MNTFKRTNVDVYKKSGSKVTPDTLHWKKFDVPVLVKEFGPIDYIDFSPVEPHYFAVTCSVRVQIYNSITKLVQKNLNRFQETAYGGSFRKDGRLLCAGGEEKHVKLFDVSSKSLLRVFRGHTSAVHRCAFTLAGLQVASFSDDKSVCLWDIPSEKAVLSYGEHSDYVRAGAASPVSPEIVLSGSYDNTAHMYDTRTKARVLAVDHGCPVESVMFLPTGGVFLTAGGTEVRVWDALAGGRLRARISQHHKTITCLALASGNKRLLSGSLDRHVKIYDIASFQAVHTLHYPAAVLSLGVSAGDETVVAGMVDGLVSISQRQEDARPTKRERRKPSYRFAGSDCPAVDALVLEETHPVLAKHDTHLRKFEYSKALDSVLVPYVAGRNPHVTVAVVQELMRRKGLEAALASRDEATLLKILKFVVRNLSDDRFTRVLIDFTNIFLDVYEGSVTQSSQLRKMMESLAKRVSEEEALVRELVSLQGCLFMLTSAASCTGPAVPQPQLLALKPSLAAQNSSVINVA
ncbi:U3 small nucleolar RNA-associated protein 15 homolog [Bacillus rossius redtenbacheri]|uniref:U3 small nucleolar RNA-associated protein 15 homolog n=1 Tax=Bacillus rossius redtenbacheri TaxID=93214 RepID=UPI002FDF0091